MITTEPTPLPLCPCGCGTRLARYNGARRLVCNGVWNRLSPEAVTRYMVAPTKEDIRQVARAAYKIARGIAAERKGGAR